MHVGMVLEMARRQPRRPRRRRPRRAAGSPSRELGHRPGGPGTWLAAQPGDHVVLVDENSLGRPRSRSSASAIAGKPFVPVNYRLADDRLRVDRRAGGARDRDRRRRAWPSGSTASTGSTSSSARDFLATVEDESIEETDGWGCDPDGTAVLLFTSGTTGEPKAAVLRHRNLASYLVGSLEFGSAGEDEATIVSVPPYHIAAVSSVLSTTYTGRRVCSSRASSRASGCDAVRDGVGHPRHGRADDAQPHPRRRRGRRGGLPSMRSLAYGGGPMPRPVVERAMRLLDGLDLVNAYGLTETSSTIAVLGPDDHRRAFASDDPERPRAPRLGRPRAARGRAVDPRSRGPAGGRRRARRDLGARRAGVGRVPRGRPRDRRRRLVQHARQRAAWTTRATSSCTAARRRDRAGRREPLARRDRDRAARAPGRRGGRRGRHPGRRVGRAGGRGGRAPARRRRSTRPSCATTSAARCGRPARPSGSRSATSCRSTRPASSSAGCCATSWPTSSARPSGLAKARRPGRQRPQRATTRRTRPVTTDRRRRQAGAPEALGEVPPPRQGREHHRRLAQRGHVADRGPAHGEQHEPVRRRRRPGRWSGAPRHEARQRPSQVGEVPGREAPHRHRDRGRRRTCPARRRCPRSAGRPPRRPACSSRSGPPPAAPSGSSPTRCPAARTTRARR